MARSLDLNSAGEARASDASQGIEVAFQVSAAALSSLESEIRSVCPGWQQERPPLCADCFDYGMRFESGGRSVEFRANDINLGTMPTAPLVERLQSLVLSALGGTPAPGG